MKLYWKKVLPYSSSRPLPHLRQAAAARTAVRRTGKKLKIGVTAGPHAEVMEEVAKEAAKQGITLKVVEFTTMCSPTRHFLRRIWI